MAYWKDADPTTTFDGRAELYERSRPGYPAAALDAMLDGLPASSLGASLAAADIGAGTGRLARELAGRGLSVIAVEPNAQMRALCPTMPGLSVVAGRAEDTGLAAASVDLVTCAQSFHWFEAGPALAELWRILRPGGRLALVWNDRRRATPFERDYHELLRRLKPPERREAPPPRSSAALHRSPLFEGLCERDFELEHALDAETLVARTLSLSYAPAGADERARLGEELRALHARHAGGAATLVLGYRTELHLAGRADAAWRPPA